VLSKIYLTLRWLPSYLGRKIWRSFSPDDSSPRRIIFAICDHYEPYWNKVDSTTASARIAKWLDRYPAIACKYADSRGNILKYSFFYPIDEYRYEDMELLARLCRQGFGEVEVHLHHDNDTSDNLRRTLLDYKRRLHEQHGLLAKNREDGTVSYGFIHGNWALDNSRPDGRWCGVNDEISILEETGCYADFTLPSAPSSTQTRKVNSIYFATDDLGKPKSHDTGRDVTVGTKGKGLLMIQGPLALSWHTRKFGILPKIENSGIHADSPPCHHRTKQWIDTAISISGAKNQIFVKVYTHGTQEDIMEMLFEKGGFDRLFLGLQEYAAAGDAELHFVSAREMANIVLATEADCSQGLDAMRDYKFTSNIVE
jgi:hypothetical protein